jgi:hypothetical protein
MVITNNAIVKLMILFSNKLRRDFVFIELGILAIPEMRIS